MVDHYSKWVCVEPIRNKQATTIVNMFSSILSSMLSVPTKVMTDNGPEFTAIVFDSFLSSHGISHQLTTPYKPTSNGAVERVNRTVQGFLRSLCALGNRWDDELSKAVITYNHTYHAELKRSPSSSLLTESHDCLVPSLNNEELHNRWRVGHPKYQSFRVGQAVLIKIPVTDHLTRNKLSFKFRGPLTVTKVNDNVTYVLKDPHLKQVIRAHHTDLWAYKHPPTYLLEHPWFQAANAELVNSTYNKVAMVPSFSMPASCSLRGGITGDSSSSSTVLSSECESQDMEETSSQDSELIEIDNKAPSSLATNYVGRSILKTVCACCKYELYMEDCTTANNTAEIDAGQLVEADENMPWLAAEVASPSNGANPSHGEDSARGGGTFNAEFWEVSLGGGEAEGECPTASPNTSTDSSVELPSYLVDSRSSSAAIPLRGIEPERIEAVDKEGEVEVIGKNTSGGTLEDLEGFIDDSFKGFVESGAISDNRITRLDALTKGGNLLSRGDTHSTLILGGKHSTPIMGVRQTRSMGAAPNLPNVQPRILERKTNAGVNSSDAGV